MAAPKIIQLLTCILYGLIGVISLFIIGPIASSMTKHNGQCLLYAKTSAGYGLNSTCNFCIAIAVIFCLLYGCILAVCNVLVLIGKFDQYFVGRKFLILAIVETVISMLIFITACIISVGFKTLCDSLTEFYDGTCSEMYIKNPKDSTLDTSFYTTLTVAQAGSWIAFFLWLGKVGLNFFTLRSEGSLSLPCCPRTKRPEEKQPEQEKY